METITIIFRRGVFFMKQGTFKIINEFKLNQLGEINYMRSKLDTQNVDPENTYKTVEMMQGLFLILRVTKDNLHGYFTLGEVNIILQALPSESIEMHDYCCPKTKLISSVEGLINSSNTNNQKDIYNKKLIEKLKALTEFQCFTVLIVINKVYEINGRNTSVIDDEKLKGYLRRPLC